MKTLRSFAITALSLLALTTSFEAQARNEKLVYHKAYNSSIGIRVEHATGASYAIKDEKGNVVLRGTIKGSSTFFIPTAKLPKGIYRFCIGSLVLQEFVIK